MGNILITGANGQLGNELRVLSGGKENFFFTDVAELDITDASAIEQFMAEHRIETVINCAAFTNVDKAEDCCDLADKLNNEAVANIARSCKSANAFFIHISTDYVFDGEKCIPYTESEKPFPTGVYGRTKLAGEKSVLESGCSFVIIRTAWLYSEYGNNFVKTMRRLFGEKESISVVFDQVGTPTYALDLAKAILNIAGCETRLEHQGIYHFSNEGVCSWYDFAVAIRDLSALECNIRPCHSSEFPSKVKRPSYSVLDKTLIKSVFGIDIPYWRDSLEKCISNF
jgi:dTDP-4-dehydrorhamnose reductase